MKRVYLKHGVVPHNDDVEALYRRIARDPAFYSAEEGYDTEFVELVRGIAKEAIELGVFNLLHERLSLGAENAQAVSQILSQLSWEL